KTLTFRLAGINNQNFIMRDEETGTYWQQVSGAAIAGPLRGAHLELVPMDELSFALWRQESPAGSVLAPVANYAKYYEKKDWENEIAKTRTVVDVSGTSLAGGELMDSASGSRWNFQGCATSGQAQGKCLEAIPYLKDYWFDWHNYHPATTVYSR